MGEMPDSSRVVASQTADGQVDQMQKSIEKIVPPVTLEEARLLLNSFGPDECFGLAWAVLHLIESAGGDVITEKPPPDANEWGRRLWDRAERGRGRGWK